MTPKVMTVREAGRRLRSLPGRLLRGAGLGFGARVTRLGTLGKRRRRLLGGLNARNARRLIDVQGEVRACYKR